MSFQIKAEQIEVNADWLSVGFRFRLHFTVSSDVFDSSCCQLLAVAVLVHVLLISIFSFSETVPSLIFHKQCDQFH